MKKFIFWSLFFVSTIALGDYVQTLQVNRGGTGSNSQSANVVVTTNGSGDLVSTSSTTATELGYVHGVTSAIQTQINGLAVVGLNNLSGVAINTSLLPASTGSANIGSASLPFGADYEESLELYSTNSISVGLQAQSGTTAWTIQPPTAPCPSGYYWADNGSGVYSCAAPASMGANVELSNLSAVAINTSLLPASAGSASIGSASLPFAADYEEALELYSTSSIAIAVEAPSGATAWTIQVPPAACLSGQVWEDNGSGVYSCVTVAPNDVIIVNGGDSNFSIASVSNQHVRSGTTLTAQRTYTLPVCTAPYGMKITVKNLESQSFNIILAGNGSDVLDGSASMTLLPGDSQTVDCSVSGYWDEE